MLLLEAIARLSRSTLSGAVKGLLGVAALLVLAGPASGVVEQDCALPGADCTLAETARQAGVFVGADDREPRSAGGASHDSARFQLDHARERDEVGGAWRRRLGTTTSRMLTRSPTSPPPRASGSAATRSCGSTSYQRISRTQSRRPPTRRPSSAS